MKARILVVDDEKEVRELLADILTSEDHEVQTSADGTEGLALFSHDHFDIVFTDLGMPGISGWQVAEEVKKISITTPVAVITGWEVKMDASELKKRGVDFIVNKPFQIQHMLKLVEKGMELKENPGNE